MKKFIMVALLVMGINAYSASEEVVDTYLETVKSYQEILDFSMRDADKNGNHRLASQYEKHYNMLNQEFSEERRKGLKKTDEKTLHHMTLSMMNDITIIRTTLED